MARCRISERFIRIDLRPLAGQFISDYTFECKANASFALLDFAFARLIFSRQYFQHGCISFSVWFIAADCEYISEPEKRENVILFMFLKLCNAALVISIQIWIHHANRYALFRRVFDITCEIARIRRSTITSSIQNRFMMSSSKILNISRINLQT